jgi:hypothetical protein
VTWAELVDKHWAPCYALALFALVWLPGAAVAVARNARGGGRP